MKEPLLTLYAVRNRRGQYLARRQLWTTELKDARIYPKIGAARRMVTNVANANLRHECPEEGIPELVGLEITNVVAFTEEDRVKTSQSRKAMKEAEYKKRDAATKLAKAQRQVAEAQEVIERLKRLQ